VSLPSDDGNDDVLALSNLMPNIAFDVESGGEESVCVDVEAGGGVEEFG